MHMPGDDTTAFRLDPEEMHVCEVRHLFGDSQKCERGRKTDILFTCAHTHIHNDPLHMILPLQIVSQLHNRYSEDSMSLASGHHRIMVATQTGPS